MSKFKDIWNNAVWSKLIAEFFKWVFKNLWFAFIIPLWALIKSVISKTNFFDNIKLIWHSIVDFFVVDFKFNFLSIILVIAAYILIAIIIRWLIRRLPSSKIRSYNQDILWRANIKWKWVKEKGNLEIKYGDYELSCPICYHDLVHAEYQGQHYLKCRNNLNCTFMSEVFHVEPQSSVRIIADMTTYYFHTSLESSVNAKLRKMGLKK